MASFETTEFKLKSLPNDKKEQGPYYRRLLSAGYKGFLQGSVGGGALYGMFGLVIGGLVTLAAGAFLPASIGITMGAIGAVVIPAFVGAGVLHGAATFGNIGSVAAINAESSDLSEQRRYLLDRYYDLPEGPEGDREAAVIKRELLARQADNQVAPPFFHTKTVLIGAAIGAVLVFGLMTLAPTSFAASAIVSAFGGSSTAATFLAPLAAGLLGATMGIDRYYIRKWFDHAQDVVHSSSHTENVLDERSQLISRLREANVQDQKTKQELQYNAAPNLAPDASTQAATTIKNDKPADHHPPAVELNKPAHTISAARRDGLMEMHQALDLAPPARI